MRPSLLMHPKQNRQILPTLPTVTTQTGVNNQITDSMVKDKGKYKGKGEEVDLEVKVRGEEEVDRVRGVGEVEHPGARRGLLGEVRLLLPSRRRCDEEVSGND
jgi:hypothetical protein